ncbi:MAG: FAD-dependent thymidylate synthase [Candidatus Magnetoovum sp. WYHC-5]|nr:FAD-dependent thymidylate synthase [Candidatus Magnetoovum sp. WYHC-5]
MGEVKLNVKLIRCTLNPEEIVALAAKLCYSPVKNIDELQEKISVDDQQQFIKKLIDIGHLSPIEHATFTFAIEGISRSCSHQIVRHRLASYSQQSQRYVSKESNESDLNNIFDYIVPPSLANDGEALSIFNKFMEYAQHTYNAIVERLNHLGYQGELAFQDARFVLPNACETKLIMTMNARELLHFFNQRCCNRAQWEIHALADAMLREAKRAAPVLFNLAGPGCLSGACEEGSFSCGKINEVRRKYEILQ